MTSVPATVASYIYQALLHLTAGESVILIVLAVTVIPVLIAAMTSWLRARRLKQDRGADARRSAAY